MSYTIKNPKYEEIDLGTFNEEYAGQKVRVLVNPPRTFRAAYNSAAVDAIFGTAPADAFMECLSVVLDMPLDSMQEYVANLPIDAMQWLFLYTLDGFDGERFSTRIAPHIYRVWDDWIVTRVKAFAAPPKASAQPTSE